MIGQLMYLVIVVLFDLIFVHGSLFPQQNTFKKIYIFYFFSCNYETKGQEKKSQNLEILTETCNYYKKCQNRNKNNCDYISCDYKIISQ